MPDLMGRVATLARRAAPQARATARGVLVSASEPVPGLDPLAALDAVAAAARTDDDLALLLRAGRAFWTSPGRELTIAAIGAATTIAPSGADRFDAADTAWRSLLEHALVDDHDAGAHAAGPLLVGGFSFTPEGPHTAPWRDFPGAHLIVPALHLAATSGGSRLTVSTLVTPDGSTSVALDLLARLRALVLAAPSRERGARTERVLPPAIIFGDVQPKASWRALVGDALAAIGEGRFEKVVVARAVQGVAPGAVDVIALLAQLRAVHRTTYVFGYWRGESAFVGASPELLVRVSGGGGDVDASSLAGSMRRGATPAEDARLAAELLASGKNRAEHAMVHRALRGALARLCDDVTSNDEPSLLTLPHVHHLHTAVHAHLRAGRSLLELAGALHPTPAVGGSPREPALEFLREHEQLDRGWYAAPIGWVGRTGGELAVALRSALVSRHEATLFAGCGIVAGSDPAQELAESEIKLRPMQSALEATLAGLDVRPVGVAAALERPA